MAAIDTPWMTSMSAATSVPDDPSGATFPSEPTVRAPFSPNSSVSTPYPRQRSTILVHEKSPLLLATPPQVTRALAFSYPFLHPLSRLLGLISWTTGDPWESFLLLAAFWFSTLYGDQIIRWTGPLVLASALILAMYARRFSSLSSNQKDRKASDKDKGKKRAGSKPEPRKLSNHPKSLDEIVDALQQLTTRCNILLDPFLRLTDFLSTQVTATSATTRPALTALFVRLLILSPIWFVLTLWPLYIITTKRVVLIFGTLALSWHSLPARTVRTLLWRSRTVRKSCEILTGLSFTTVSTIDTSAPRGMHSVADIAKSLAGVRGKQKPKSDSATISAEGIRFTFSLYENQRRWIGIGWTSSMMAYERTAWTDDQLNPAPPKDQFQLPRIEGGAAKWRWAEGSEWEADLGDADSSAGAAGGPSTTPGSDAKLGGSPRLGGKEEASWIYYDNKWMHGRRGVDGWGRYTRRRKWMRDAELVDVSPNDEATPVPSPSLRPSSADSADPGEMPALAASDTAPRAIPKASVSPAHAAAASSAGSDGSAGSASGNDAKRREAAQRRSWFGRRKRSDSAATTSSIASGTTLASEAGAEEAGRRNDDGYVPLLYRGRQGALEQDWGVGDDLGMELG